MKYIKPTIITIIITLLFWLIKVIVEHDNVKSFGIDILKLSLVIIWAWSVFSIYKSSLKEIPSKN